MLLRWSIKTNDPDFPDSVITFSPGQNLGSLPLEIGILLPTVPGNRVIMEALLQPNTKLEKAAIGIFAADPFLNSDSLLTRLQRANVRWVCNLPALAQYEPNFQHYLSEIDMTLEREVKQLAQCRDVGLSTMLVISQKMDAHLLESLNPDAIAIVPSVSEFTNGFPKLSKLKTIEAEIKQDLNALGYEKPVLCYRERSEESDIPCLCRPCCYRAD